MKLSRGRAAGGDVAVNEDIAGLDQIEPGNANGIPDHDLLVGGFPCQDYSVAKSLNQAHGIEGKKGVLWWHDLPDPGDEAAAAGLPRERRPPAEVAGDPARADFAIILACLSDLGYLVEWRVVNAADYGFPQRRRRVFIVAHHMGEGASRGGAGRCPGSTPTGRSLGVCRSNRRSRSSCSSTAPTCPRSR